MAKKKRMRRIPAGGCNERERRSQLPFCLAPSRVALILALACVARLAEIAADIGAALRALASAKIHSNAAHSSISTVSWCLRAPETIFLKTSAAVFTKAFGSGHLDEDAASAVSRMAPQSA